MLITQNFEVILQKIYSNFDFSLLFKEGGGNSLHSYHNLDPKMTFNRIQLTNNHRDIWKANISSK